MGRKYVISFAPVNPNITPVTMVSILAGTTHSFRVKSISLSSNDAAGATISEVRVGRITTQGTGTANTPAPLIEDDLAFTGTARSNCSAEPTMSTVLHRKEWNLITECVFTEAELEDTSVMADAAKGIAVTLVGNPNPATVTVTMVIEEL